MKLSQLPNKPFISAPSAALNSYIMVNYADGANPTPVTTKVTLRELGNAIAADANLVRMDTSSKVLSPVVADSEGYYTDGDSGDSFTLLPANVMYDSNGFAYVDEDSSYPINVGNVMYGSGEWLVFDGSASDSIYVGNVVYDEYDGFTYGTSSMTQVPIVIYNAEGSTLQYWDEYYNLQDILDLSAIGAESPIDESASYVALNSDSYLVYYDSGNEHLIAPIISTSEEFQFAVFDSSTDTLLRMDTSGLHYVPYPSISGSGDSYTLTYYDYDAQYQIYESRSVDIVAQPNGCVMYYSDGDGEVHYSDGSDKIIPIGNVVAASGNGLEYYDAYGDLQTFDLEGVIETYASVNHIPSIVHNNGVYYLEFYESSQLQRIQIITSS